ncbi:MAG: hypothetical protein PUF13_02230 [Lachnospiraceae bacterium]|nr:hypothetical protein [Lachnospiraceae bacterium]
MSEFLKLAYELISQVIYNIAEWIADIVMGFVKVFITGWIQYTDIFLSYFTNFGFPMKILAVLLALILIAIPVVLVILMVRRIILHIQLRADKEDNTVLYKEIGRLNRQVLNLMDEKNKILALKVNTMGGVERIPYMGASALTDEVLPTVANVTDPERAVQALSEKTAVSGSGVVISGDGTAAEESIAMAEAAASSERAISNAVSGGNIQINARATIGQDAISTAAAAAVTAAAQAQENARNVASRFPKLNLVDIKYHDYTAPEFDNEITLQQFVEQYRLFAASELHLYYTQEIIRRFVAGMAASRLLILEGISGTGKTSLPYSMSRFLDNPATLVSVQPSYRDRTELLGYFNEFSKRFNETEFLRALYEANYRQDPSFIVLDEMNLARIEYYFAEMLSVLEMPSREEWVLDLVPTAWPGDPEKLEGGKIYVPDTLWFVGTANNDDSTFTITDKVYDRAIPIELNERAAAFECEPQPRIHVTSSHLEALFRKAKEEHPISEDSLEKMKKLDQYLLTRFKLSFGNRIIRQMYDFIPVYVACGGTELGGMDYIIARKVLKKFESMNVSFVRDEIKGLIVYIEKTFGRTEMPDSREYLQKIQNLY